MYWRFFMNSKATGTDTGWKWELCKENHAAFRSAERCFSTLTECMRDAAEHGYHGWSDEAPGAHAPVSEERLPMAGIAAPPSYVVPGSHRLH